MNLCPRDRLKALGIFLRQTVGLRPRVCLRKIPRAFNLALGQNSPGYPLGFSTDCSTVVLCNLELSLRVNPTLQKLSSLMEDKLASLMKVRTTLVEDISTCIETRGHVGSQGGHVNYLGGHNSHGKHINSQGHNVNHFGGKSALLEQT